jgi:hypothetical protein
MGHSRTLESLLMRCFEAVGGIEKGPYKTYKGHSRTLESLLMRCLDGSTPTHACSTWT